MERFEWSIMWTMTWLRLAVFTVANVCISISRARVAFPQVVSHPGANVKHTPVLSRKVLNIVGTAEIFHVSSFSISIADSWDLGGSITKQGNWFTEKRLAQSLG